GEGSYGAVRAATARPLPSRIGRKVGGVRGAADVDVTGIVQRDGIAEVVTAAAQISGPLQFAAVRTEPCDEHVARAAGAGSLICGGCGEVAGGGTAGYDW